MQESIEIKVEPQHGDEPEKLKIEDKLKHYQEGRTDVRTYAGFLIQVITLLLTTMILVMGWVAKDYATEKYLLAQRIVLSQSVTPIRGSIQKQAIQKPIYEVPPAQAEQRLEAENKKLSLINHIYWQQLIFSPTTSLLLSGFSTFTLLVLGLLMTITYQLQRRRYHYHGMGMDLGLESDQPVADAILIRGALNDLMILIGLAALALVVVTIAQTATYVLSSEFRVVQIGLIVVVSLVVAKTTFIGRMALSYRHYERTEGWKARWRRAHRRVQELQVMTNAQPNCPCSVKEILTELAAISAVGGAENWKTAKNLLHSLWVEARGSELPHHVEINVNALVMELKHNKIWRRSFQSRNPGISVPQDVGP